MWVNPSLVGSLVRSSWKSIHEAPHFYLQHRMLRQQSVYRIITRRFPHYKLAEGHDVESVKDELVFLNDIVIPQLMERNPSSKKIAKWMRAWLSGAVQLAMVRQEEDEDSDLDLDMMPFALDEDDVGSDENEDGEFGQVFVVQEGASGGGGIIETDDTTEKSPRKVEIKSVRRQTMPVQPIASKSAPSQATPLGLSVDDGIQTHRRKLSRTASSLSLNEERLQDAARELAAAATQTEELMEPLDEQGTTKQRDVPSRPRSQPPLLPQSAVLTEEVTSPLLPTPWLVLPSANLDPAALQVLDAVNRVGKWLIDAPDLSPTGTTHPAVDIHGEEGTEEIEGRGRRRFRSNKTIDAATPSKPATPISRQPAAVAWHEIPWQFVALLTYPEIPAPANPNQPRPKVPLAVLRDIALVRQRRRVLLLLSLWTLIIRYCSFDLFVILAFLSNCAMLFLMKNSRQVNSTLAKRALRQRWGLVKQWAGGWIPKRGSSHLGGSATLAEVPRGYAVQDVTAKKPRSNTDTMASSTLSDGGGGYQHSPHMHSRTRLGFFRSGRTSTAHLGTSPPSVILETDATAEDKQAPQVGRLRFFRKTTTAPTVQTSSAKTPPATAASSIAVMSSPVPLPSNIVDS